MKNLVVLGSILVVFLGYSQERDKTTFRLIDRIAEDLKKSINERDFSFIQEHLSANYQYQNIKGTMASNILRQVVDQYPKVDSILVISKLLNNESEIYTIAIYAINGIENKRIILDENQKILSADIAEIALRGHDTNYSNEHDDNSLYEFSFKLSQTQHMVVGASINGVDASFIIDSGFGGYLMLNSEYFQLHETSSGESALGVNGQLSDNGLSIVNEFKWGKITKNQFEVDISPLDHLGKAMGIEKFGGLIGAGFYIDKVIAVDYNKKKFIIGHSSDQLITKFQIKDTIRLSISMVYHVPVINCYLLQKKYRLGIDLGAQSNMLSEKLQNNVETHLLNKRIEQLQGADGRVKQVTKGQVTGIEISSQKYTMDFVFGNLFGGNHEVTLIDGLLGHPFLSSQPIIIDFVQQQLILFK